jgi:glycosyl hydrolase family 39 (putative alpha-L-iduronidase)
MSKQYLPTMLLWLIVAFLLACGNSGSSIGTSTPVSAGGAPTTTASSISVTPQYFGMHVHNAGNWPSIAFGSLRLWDAGVAWPNLEPTKGQWNFSTLDNYVSISQQNSVEVDMVLGLSPQWASARPNEPSVYNPGNAAEPQDIQDWRDFVQAIVTRYKGKIQQYEIWNEPNDPTFFSGTPDKMLQLASEAYKIVKQVDPSALVISPAVTEASSLPWLDNYLSIGGGNYADVIGYHFYVSPNPPESIVSLASQVRAIMSHYGQQAKPLWSTESGWHPPATFATTAQEAAYVTRAYVLAWASGASRFYWYAWDDHDWVSLQLTNADGSLRPSAQALAVLRGWILNSDLKPCSSDSAAVWICDVIQGNRISHIVWSPSGSATFAIPQTWKSTTTVDLTGQSSPLPATQMSIQVSASPMLFIGS